MLYFLNVILTFPCRKFSVFSLYRFNILCYLMVSTKKTATQAVFRANYAIYLLKCLLPLFTISVGCGFHSFPSTLSWLLSITSFLHVKMQRVLRVLNWCHLERLQGKRLL